jgi:hypothetical protein
MEMLRLVGFFPLHLLDDCANTGIGNAQGNVILFEPSTSEHISARTIDQVPITALAPSADCRTYAIGFVVCIGLEGNG